jgi:hypothetical protein
MLHRILACAQARARARAPSARARPAPPRCGRGAAGARAGAGAGGGGRRRDARADALRPARPQGARRSPAAEQEQRVVRGRTAAAGRATEVRRMPSKLFDFCLEAR